VPLPSLLQVFGSKRKPLHIAALIVPSPPATQEQV
jgi:hypothetical protein